MHVGVCTASKQSTNMAFEKEKYDADLTEAKKILILREPKWPIFIGRYIWAATGLRRSSIWLAAPRSTFRKHHHQDRRSSGMPSRFCFVPAPWVTLSQHTVKDVQFFLLHLPVQTLHLLHDIRGARTGLSKDYLPLGPNHDSKLTARERLVYYAHNPQAHAQRHGTMMIQCKAAFGRTH